jgi:hypothetical protein
VSESWAHQVLSGLWEAERDPLMRPLRGRIAKDEAAHGQFGWIFLDWLDPEPGDRALLAQAAAKAVRAVKANIEATIRRPEVDFGPLTPLGGLGKSGYIELANDAPQQRVLAPLAARSLAVE